MPDEEVWRSFRYTSYAHVVISNLTLRNGFILTLIVYDSNYIVLYACKKYSSALFDHIWRIVALPNIRNVRKWPQ